MMNEILSILINITNFIKAICFLCTLFIIIIYYLSKCIELFYNPNNLNRDRLFFIMYNLNKKIADNKYTKFILLFTLFPYLDPKRSFIDLFIFNIMEVIILFSIMYIALIVAFYLVIKLMRFIDELDQSTINIENQNTIKRLEIIRDYSFNKMYFIISLIFFLISFKR